MTVNTIVLLHGFARWTGAELVNHNQYDTLGGCDSTPTEEMRWSIDKIEEARAELAKHACTYDKYTGMNDIVDIEEWCIEYREADEDGEDVEYGDAEYADGEWPFEVYRIGWNKRIRDTRKEADDAE